MSLDWTFSLRPVILEAMRRTEFLAWSVLMIAVMAIAFYGTADRVNWLLDACWVVVGVPLLLVTRKRFPLTPLLYRLTVIHALVLVGGGYWTYEEMPIGLWLKASLSFRAQSIRSLWSLHARLRARDHLSRNLCPHVSGQGRLVARLFRPC
jgi:uncharacterized membrane protein YjdF